MDIIVIAVVWIIFSIIGAIIKNASSSKKSTTNKSNGSTKEMLEKKIESVRPEQNKKKSKSKNNKRGDKQILDNLRDTLNQQNDRTTTSKKNRDIISSIDDIEAFDTNIDDNNIYNNSAYDSDSSSVVVQTEIASIKSENFVTDESFLYGQKEESSNLNYVTTSTNMFEQAVIYDAIFNRRGKGVGCPRSSKK